MTGPSIPVEKLTKLRACRAAPGLRDLFHLRLRPFCTPGLCQMCREADRKAAAQRRRRFTQERRPTPRSTDAILYCVQSRGLAALKEPPNLERLHRCDAQAQREIDGRIDKLFESGILKR